MENITCLNFIILFCAFLKISCVLFVAQWWHFSIVFLRGLESQYIFCPVSLFESLISCIIILLFAASSLAATVQAAILAWRQTTIISRALFEVTSPSQQLQKQQQTILESSTVATDTNLGDTTGSWAITKQIPWTKPEISIDYWMTWRQILFMKFYYDKNQKRHFDPQFGPIEQLGRGPYSYSSSVYLFLRPSMLRKGSNGFIWANA